MCEPVVQLFMTGRVMYMLHVVSLCVCLMLIHDSPSSFHLTGEGQGLLRQPAGICTLLKCFLVQYNS